MYDKLDYKLLISTAEALELVQFRTLKDSYIAQDIYNEYKKTETKEYSLAWVLGIIWNAGRIQGIREERSKRKSDNKNSATNRV